MNTFVLGFIRKRSIFITALVFVAMVDVLLLLIFLSTAYGSEQPEYVTVVVREGDTLWDLASVYRPEGDIRESIYIIKKENHLKSGTLQVGQQLLIPID